MNESTAPEPSRPQFPSDRAITRSSEDELGRNNFAARLAEAIYGCDAREGLVIALSGPWGCGKSSIKNMALERLRGMGSGAPDVLEFNPWQVSGQEQITLTFFRELLAKVGKDGQDHDPDKTKQRAAVLAKYSSYLPVTSTALKTVGTFLPLLNLAGAAGGAIGEAIKKGAEATAAQATADTESLSSLKAKLHELFAALERPLLVVIDDIDRLSAKEVPQIFQLVKANADFPKVIYLLLHDKLTVEKALDDISNQRGKEFLEKIVQVSFDVPAIPQGKIDRVLYAGLIEALGSATIQRRWNKDRWTSLYTEHLQHYFSNLRAVHRFLASLSFQIGLLRGPGGIATGSLEVNPVDLITLECLRLFEPSGVYSRLLSLKGILTRKRGNRFIPKEIGQEEVDRIVTSIVDPVPSDRKEAVTSLLQELFPPITSDYANSTALQAQTDDWFRDVRVCHEDLFDRYFHLELGENEMSQADTDRLIESLGDRETARAELLSLKERGLLATAVDHLDRYAKTVKPESVESGVLALCDVSDDLPDRSRFWIFDDPEIKVWRICYWLLRQVKDPAARASVIERVIRESDGLRLPLKLVNFEERSTKAEAQGHDHLVQEAELDRLKTACADRCRAFATSQPVAFSRRDDLMQLLWVWKTWGNDAAEVNSWIQSLLSTPAGLLAFMSKNLNMSSDSTTISWSMQLAPLEQFVPADEVEAKLAALNLEGADEGERLAVRCFKEALQNRRDGKQPDPYFSDDQESETWEHYEQRRADAAQPQRQDAKTELTPNAGTSDGDGH